MRYLAGIGLAVVLVASLTAGTSGTSAASETIYGVTANGELITFSKSSPGNITARVPITGLSSGERIVGIDVRPATNQLYGLGSGSQIYTINVTSGAVTKVGSPFTPALSGTFFGFDFNPAVDRIRIVSDTGQNLRAHPDTGAIAAVDGPIAYAATDVNGTGPQAGVIAVAYTNPDNDGATGTVLFDIDMRNATLSRQDPPNNGTLQTVGTLGVATNDVVGFDIGSGPPDALIALRPGAGGPTRLYRVDLTTGKATDLGTIGTNETVTGIAIAIQAAPAPAASPSPAATTTRVAPAAPNTGSGTPTGGGTDTTWLLLVVSGAIALTGAAVARATAAVRRDR